MRVMRWIAAAVVLAALAAGIVWAALDDRPAPPIPAEHGDPGDPSAYPQPQVSGR